MEFRALGPVAILRDGEEVDLGSRKQRAVIALLLVHHNEVLQVDRILDELWAGEGDDKLNALRVYVSRLRSALDPERARGEDSILETVGTGYRLNVDVDHFDIAWFERGVAQGRELLSTDPVAAAETLRSALSLWRGDAFEDFAYEEFVQTESRRLSEARVDALEDRVEADLATGLAGEVVSELEVLRDRHPLRERLVSHHALALYRSGRPAEALRAIDRFRRHVGEELGIDPSPRLLRLEEQMLLHDDSVQPNGSNDEQQLRAKLPAVNPFKGLRAFGTDDAGSFFGRDALVADLLRSFGRGQHLIALVGASGSGKSSAVRAGLIPALAKGAIEGSDDWLVANMVPGAHPFAELEAALLRSAIDVPASLAEQLRDDEAGLVRAALRILPSDDSHLLLIIDQFEELFTLVEDEAVRERFLSNLVAAVDDPHDRITVLLTLRADFYGEQLHHPEFGARLGAGVVNVTALTAEELEAAALRPAAEVGVSFEPALLGQLIADVGNQPGSLPLFQYTLTELFDRRASDTLAASSYRSMGGLDGALQRRATDLFEQLDAEQQEAARQLFLRLVVVSDGDQRSRRRVPAREVASLAIDTATIQHVIGLFGEHRLLSFDSDLLTGAPTVEVAHEALLTAWPVLDAWIDQSRGDLRRHASLMLALREWQIAEEHPDYLLTSARLAEFDDWLDASLLRLNAAEREFLEASAARAGEEREREERRRQDEARSRRRLWTLVGTLAAMLAVAGLFLFGVVGAGENPTVTFFGDRGDGGWNANIGAGLDRAANEFDMDLVDVPWVVDPGLDFRALAETGPEIVITDGTPLYSDRAVLADFPDVRFGIVDDVAPVESDATSILFANEEGGYLAGAAAALKTETGVIGFIGGADIPAIDEFRAGFEAGALAARPDITVLATFVNQFGELDGAGGFANPDVAAQRARALYQRDADVIFTAAGFSGFGTFDVVVEESAASGRFLWAIGVDNDQWFDVTREQQPHVLTSVIKRGDVAAYRLVEHMLGDGPTGVIGRVGLGDGGFTYSQQGDGLTSEMVEVLDQLVAGFGSGEIQAPTAPTGPILLFDADGNEINGPDAAAEQAEVSVDGFEGDGPTEPGTYELEALGTSLTVTLEESWWVPLNILGHTATVATDSTRPGDRDVVFLRPHALSDPAQPNAAPELQAFFAPDSIDAWLDELIDGVAVTNRETTQIAGRAATYFEVEITDPSICGNFGFCAGFLANTVSPEGAISGWSFEVGFHHRIWWVDQGDEAPLVIIASTPSDDRGFQARADALLGSLVIGDPEPHPVPFDEAGIER